MLLAITLAVTLLEKPAAVPVVYPENTPVTLTGDVTRRNGFGPPGWGEDPKHDAGLRTGSSGSTFRSKRRAGPSVQSLLSTTAGPPRQCRSSLTTNRNSCGRRRCVSAKSAGFLGRYIERLLPENLPRFTWNRRISTFLRHPGGNS